jgi:hypothetical protein
MLCVIWMSLSCRQLATSSGLLYREEVELGDSQIRWIPASFLPQVVGHGQECAGKLRNTWHWYLKGLNYFRTGRFPMFSILDAWETRANSWTFHFIWLLRLLWKTGLSIKIFGLSSRREENSVFPYFQESIWLLRLLNKEGNALATFVQILQQWGVELGL